MAYSLAKIKQHKDEAEATHSDTYLEVAEESETKDQSVFIYCYTGDEKKKVGEKIMRYINVTH